MKLRKLFATATMALLVGASVTAEAVSVKDVRIYINPGHGSWGPDNRHVATIGHSPISSTNPDTTDFYESNTNLQKGLALLGKLESYGVPFDHSKNQTNSNKNRIGAALDLSQNIVMSHVKCGPYPYNTTNGDKNNDFNRSLSVIAAEVEENDFDMFISIHSNAANSDGATTNYLYYAYREGYQPVETSKKMAIASWNQRIKDRHTQWTHYDRTITDVSQGKIGHQALGVLKHTVPGWLAEGYFHTYQPARHRYMNFDVCHLEGVDYARGVADYFSWAKETTGDIYGIIRDKRTKFTDALYKPNPSTNDVYKPLNNVEVTLLQGEKVVATYKTDINYNGVFVFRDLTPGTYTMTFKHDDYKPMASATAKSSDKLTESLSVTVTAASTSYPTVFLEPLNYVEPEKTHYNYPDYTEGLNLSLAEAYNFSGVEKVLLATQLEGKTVRRQIIRDNKLYVLALDAENEPYIYLADIATGTVTELDKSGLALSTNAKLKLSDIALTADNVLVGSGLSLTFSQESKATEMNAQYPGVLNFYKWTKNDNTELPEKCELWFESNYFCEYYKCLFGQTLAYSGTIKDGYIVASGQTATGSTLRMAKITITDSKKASEIYFRGSDNASYFSVSKMTDNNEYQLMVSPLGDDNFVFDGNICAPFEWTATNNAEVPTVTGKNALVNVKSNGANYFRYAGKSLMVAPTINSDGKVAGLEMYDITEGFDNAKVITLNTTLEEPLAYTYASAHGELAVELDDEENVTDAKIELFLVVDGKVFKYTTDGVEQASSLNAFAYNLTMTENDNKAVLGFNLSAPTDNAEIILSSQNDGENKTYNLGALNEGANSYEIDLSKLSNDKYTWSVSVENKTNLGSDIMLTENSWGASESTAISGGVAIDNNPESDNFGTVYVSTSSKGIFTFTADGTAKNETGYWENHSGDLTNGTVSNGKYYVADNSADKAGIWMLDPVNPAAETQVSNNAKSCAVAFQNEGANRVMYSASDVISAVASGASGYQLYKYAIGEKDSWTGNPVWVSAADAKMFGSAHHSLIAVENGLFISQYRTSSSNYAPAFFFIDNAGKVYNYATDLQSILPGTDKGGMALSKDESLFAIADVDSEIQIFDVTWENGIPKFDYKTTLTTNDGSIRQMAFDYAGNLHCYSNKAGYYVHAVPCNSQFTVTPAKASLVIKGTGASAIEVIEAEDAEAPVEYYNLQGVKVANPEQGIFIKKQGNKATKVVL